MRRWMLGGMSAAALALAVIWLAAPELLQGQVRRPMRNPNGQGQPGQQPLPGQNGGQGEDGAMYKEPEDPKLAKLHKDYITEATKLVIEYDKKKDLDKLRAVCEDILRVMPKHPGAQEMLKKIHAEEATAETAKLEVLANKGWQETGVIVQAGKPISIRAVGTWTFNAEADLGPNGMEIPKEWRDFNLGSL
ncbi:MAG TPA: hypothetical protein VGE52_17370, partial [Pirellulales bacterium]